MYSSASSSQRTAQYIYHTSAPAVRSFGCCSLNPKNQTPAPTQHPMATLSADPRRHDQTAGGMAAPPPSGRTYGCGAWRALYIYVYI